MKIHVTVKIKIAGLHQWKECNLKEVEFLKHSHRHIFHIKCEKEVKKSNREIEIILFKSKIITFLTQTFNLTDCGALDFGNNSCEDIAKLLLKTFNLSSCEVLEDDENGAKVYK